MPKFAPINVLSFISVSIPKLIAKGRQLKAIFMTYNTVEGHNDGPVATNKTGLEITVATGNMRFDPLRAMLGMHAEAIGDFQTANVLWEGVEADGREAEREVVTKVLPVIEGGQPGNFLAVIYAGISAFKEATRTAREVHRKIPGAHIVILTCDCDLHRKLNQLESLVESGEIQEVVVTGWCGGHGDMGEMVDALIDAWPA